MDTANPITAHLISAAAEKWSSDLLDRSGRNPLLYYRDLSRGTLDLSAGGGADQTALAELADSRKTRLSRLFAEPDRLKDAARRARTVAAKARENDEERGVQTLFLAWGLTSWTNQRTSGPGSSSIPAAPLLLTPLSLKARSGAAEDFDLRISGEWAVNPTLLHHLETEFDFRFDGGRNGEFSSIGERMALADRLTAQARGEIPDFSVEQSKAVVGNFSYQKLAMVKDIQEAEENGLLGEHDLLAAIAGDTEARSRLRTQHANFEPINPDMVHPSEEFLVLDADASQSGVINTVLAGRDLVVEGPPGTGKSQTISNLIAALVASKQTVLFVAEKRAAIDAVLKRLRDNDLDITLDLHETGASSLKRRVANDLRMTLDKYTNSQEPDVQPVQENLSQHRRSLNEHTASVHKKRDPWGETLYSIEENLITLRGKVVPSHIRFKDDILPALAEDDWKQALRDLRQYVDLGGLALLPETEWPVSPWALAYQAGKLTARDQISDSLEALRFLDGHLAQILRQWQKFADELGFRMLNTVSEWKDLVGFITEIEELCEYVELAAYELDRELLNVIAESKPSLFLIFNGQYRQAIKEVKQLWRHNTKPSRRMLHKIVDKIVFHHTTWGQYGSGDESVFPQNLPASAKDEEISATLEKIEQVVEQTGDPELPGLTFEKLQERVGILLDHQETLLNLADITELGLNLSTRGLKQVLVEASRRRLDTEETTDLARYVWYESLLDHIRLDDRSIRTFSGEALNRTVEQYKRVDQQHIESGKDRVRRQVAKWSRDARNDHHEENLLVRKQANLKRGHMTVRRLLQEAPNVLRALKPCWAMSPLLVAETLPQEQLFDVVIFDEASQVTAADAIGPIMRAGKVVVTGDTKQLPPTRFFMGSIEEEDEDEENPASLTSGFESILDVMATLLSPPHGTRNLSWHYRSRNERLIAFSNAQPTLYDGSLTTFPGTANDDCVNHVLTDHDPGGTGKQVREANRVVELIFEHARQRPEESLGVITMGVKHAGLVEELLRNERAEHPELDHWLDHGPPHLSDSEPLFIKNIERVQGDERDSIILSVGYGRGQDGRMVHRFGPLNVEGGERRLNVAVTRARRRMTVVSSFASADLDPNKLKAEGARMLGAYLAYAETGGEHLGFARTNKTPLNGFERDIQKGLREAGIPLVAQYGSAGYWIDFAAAHPERPGQMVLAIEADGARYHSSRTARDRDRLRQEHLERIGWRFHRIWSTDWFLHREQEIEKAVTAWKRAAAETDAPSRPAAPPPAEAPPESEGNDRVPQRQGPCPVDPGDPIGEYSPQSLVKLIRWIESDGRLLTDSELMDIAIKELGFARRGSRIVEALQKAINETRQTADQQAGSPAPLG